MNAASVIFLDRDGVINRLVVDAASGRAESPYRPDDVRLLPRAVDGLRVLAGLDVPLVVVSNQPSAAKGATTLAMLEAVHREVERQLEAAGVGVWSWRYCFHYAGGASQELGVDCECRKPAPGMLLAAARELGVTDLSRSWIIGDSDVDVLAGRAAGCHTIVVDEPASAHRRTMGATADATCANLFEAAHLVAARYAAPGVLA